MAGLFKNLFGKKGASVVGIDVGSSAIKVVQLSKRGGKGILETYGELALGPYGGTGIGRSTNLPPEKISAALSDLLKEAKVTSTDSALSIPYSSSLVTIIEMPSISQKQLGPMMPMEARKYIPVPLSEITLDWWVIPKAVAVAEFGDTEQTKIASEKIDVLLVAIQNDALNRYRTIVKSANLDASFFEIEIFSTIRSVLDQDTASHMIIDLGASGTKIYVVERGVVRGSHVVNRGAQDLTLSIAQGLNISPENAEVWKRDPSKVPAGMRTGLEEIVSLFMDFIFSEANRVLLNYEKRFNKNIPKITLVGGGARLADIEKYAKNHLQTEIDIGNPFGKTEAPAFLEEALKHTGPEFAVALGLALRKLQETP